MKTERRGDTPMKHMRTTKVLEPGAFKIDDTIAFTLTDGETVEALAVRQEGNDTVFITVDCLRKEYPLIDSYGKYTGYENSSLRTKLNGEILDRFPEELKERMVPFENGDLLRIPTEREIFGENPWGEKEPESVEQFEAMKLRRNRIAFQGHNGPIEWYWLQNRSVTSATSAASVGGHGFAGYYGASTSRGVRPLFKIHNP